MPVLFVSYRRADTAPWAGRLYDALARQLSRSQLFMDVAGRVAPGDRFGATIEAALTSCDVLLALVGPSWLDCQRDGRRRLDHPDDWVRREITSALTRGVRVVPVLCGGASLPPAEVLPAELRGLLDHLAVRLSEERWGDDVDALVADLLARVPGLTDAGAGVAPVIDALLLLVDLARELPAVAAALAESRVALADAARQLEEIQAHKDLHDALHTIELECLEPYVRAGSPLGARVFNTRLDTVHARIDGLLRQERLDAGMVDELTVNLDLAAEAMRHAVTSRTEDARAAAIEALTTLVSTVPSMLSAKIDAAACEIRWDELAPLLARLREVALQNALDRGAALEPLATASAALTRVGRELAGRVAEHSRLQGLDRQLRPLCKGASTLQGMRLGWVRVKRLRDLVAPPRSAPVELVWGELDSLGREVEAALDVGDLDRAREAVGAWFDTARIAFREVDRLLLDQCEEIAKLSQPLRMLTAVG